jgi:hypothetical protein
MYKVFREMFLEKKNKKNNGGPPKKRPPKNNLQMFVCHIYLGQVFVLNIFVVESYIFFEQKRF